jgi:D-alanine-D-alanine ligase
VENRAHGVRRRLPFRGLKLEAVLKRIPPEFQQRSIAVIMGGPSAEREFSLRSGLRVLEALEGLGLKPIGLEADDSLPRRLDQEDIEICFLATHGGGGEDGQLQGFLERTGRDFTGARVAGSSLAMNKIASKALAKTFGLSTPKWELINPSDSTESIARKSADRLGFPLVIKPIFGGSSINVRLVQNLMEFRTTFEELRPLECHLMAEAFVEGREFTVSVLEDGQAKAFPLPIMELDPQALFYDYDTKWNAELKDFSVPAELDKKDTLALETAGLQLHSGLYQRDLSRSDFIIDKEGQLFYLETNSLPGLTHNSDLPAQAQASGMTFEEVVVSVLMGPVRRRLARLKST